MTIHEVGVRKAILLEVEKYRLKMEEEEAASKLKILEQDVSAEVKLLSMPIFLNI
jgi:hypothetical protein